MVIKQGSKSFAMTGSHRQTSRIADARLAIEHRWRTSQIAVNEIKSQTCDSQHTPVLTAIRCGTVGTPSRANGSAIAARNMGSPAGSTIPKASATVCRDICRANFDNHTWSIALLRNQRYNHIGQFVSSSMVQAESPNYGHDDMITKKCFMAAIAVFGTLDTEGDELDWLRHRILTNGSKVESSSMLAHSPTAA